MSELEREVLTDEEERERSENERKEQLKKEEKELAEAFMMMKARLRQRRVDKKLEKEIRAIETKLDHIRQKYIRSLNEIKRMEEEKAPSEDQKKKLSEIDKELEELEKARERDREFSFDDPGKDSPEKEVSEKDKPEKQAEPERDSGIKAAQKLIRDILEREKPADDKGFADMKSELKAAMADIIARRVAFIDPDDARENFICGDKKNEEHYRDAYEKLMSGENSAFNRTINEMSSYESMKKIGAMALTHKAGALMLYMGDQMKKDDIHTEAKADKTKEKVLTADKELVLKPMDPYS